MSLDLRPMSTGQVLDRTFFLYRSNFWLFAGIAALPPAFVLVAQVIIVLGPLTSSKLTESAGGIAAIGLGAVLAAVLYLLGYALATGASIYAVSRAHLGKTPTIAQAYRAVSDRIVSVIGTSICVGLLFFAVTMVGFLVSTLMFAGLAKIIGPMSLFIMVPFWAVGGFFLIRLFLRYTLAVAACVLEKLGPVKSMQRSFALTQGSEGRLFLIILLSVAIVFGLTMVFSIPALAAVGIAAAKGSQPTIQSQILQMLASFLASTLSTPISIIAFSLVYYDQRVRKEAFDLTLMMEAIGQAPPPSAMGAAAGTPNSIG
jgi:hypothetical protein